MPVGNLLLADWYTGYRRYCIRTVVRQPRSRWALVGIVRNFGESSVRTAILKYKKNFFIKRNGVKKEENKSVCWRSPVDHSLSTPNRVYFDWLLIVVILTRPWASKKQPMSCLCAGQGWICIDWLYCFTVRDGWDIFLMGNRMGWKSCFGLARHMRWRAPLTEETWGVIKILWETEWSKVGRLSWLGKGTD